MLHLGKHPVKHMKVMGTVKVDEEGEYIPPTRFQTVMTMCLRSFFGVGNFALYIWSLNMIPLALATILFNLAPFWTSLLAYFVNGEAIFPVEYAAMAICFSLVVCMTLIGGQEKDD